MRHEREHNCLGYRINEGALYNIVVWLNQKFWSQQLDFTQSAYSLITSVSMCSLSLKVPEALRTGGGASIMAAPFFFLLLAKKLPKKPEFGAFMSSRDDFGGVAAAAAVTLPVFGSVMGWAGGLILSFTMAIALCPFKKSGCPVLM